jgi:glutamate N-acetyltransferase/amino-acid N-acetyltransferase
VAAGEFTTNRNKAEPVVSSQQVLTTGRARAVVLNSGGANACTGPDGFADTHKTAEHAAAALNLGAIDVAICSTGVIGDRLPLDSLLSGVDKAVATLDGDGGADAARAIMTTDTVAKTTVVQGKGWSVGGMAKGAGMLAPALATMLCVLTTDAVVDQFTADNALRAATSHTFDRIDVDGCMSTNDTVLLLASGASGVTPSYEDFAAAVRDACHDLAMQLVADAEGATKRIEIEVRNAASEPDALEVGRSVAGNALLKCALYGNDPYWGRVLAAVGTTQAEFEPDQLDVSFNGVQVCQGGTAKPGAPTVDISRREIAISVDLHAGTENATVWTTDLTPDYVHENSAYTT